MLNNDQCCSALLLAATLLFSGLAVGQPAPKKQAPEKQAAPGQPSSGQPATPTPASAQQPEGQAAPEKSAGTPDNEPVGDAGLKPVVASPEVMAMLDRMVEKEYVPGLTRYACRGTFVASMQLMEPKTGAFRYLWNGDKGNVTFDNPAHRGALQQSGFHGQILDSLFEAVDWRENFAGCTLTAAAVEAGTKISVAGEAVNSMRSLTLNSDAIAVGFEMKPPQAPEAFAANVTWIPVGDRWLRESLAMNMNLPGMGQVSKNFDFTYQEVGGFTVWKSIHQSMTMGGSVFSSFQVTFDEVQVNDAVTAPAAPDAPEAPQPTASQPK